MVVSSAGLEPLPDGTEARLAGFTELVATAIANTESRAALGLLADEQAALRRVATLVAQGVPPAEDFSAVAEEVARLFAMDSAFIARLDPDALVTILAAGGPGADEFVTGERLQVAPSMAMATVVRTIRPARTDDYEQAPPEVAERVRRMGISSTVATPIVVEGQLWGIIVASTRREALPSDTEQRLLNFTELVATAIANAESRAELTASRARIVAASDDARRRIERDLHDGAQQQLVSLAFELRAAERRVPPELAELRDELSRVAEGLVSALDDLRETSRGIHPAILAEGGLGPALKTLARRSPIPVEVDVRAETRLPEPIEVAAYYVVSEALANAAKYARASVVRVAAEKRDDVLHLSIRDDGLGGADPAKGSGLIGLRDRVEALGGSIDVSSPLGEGTLVAVELPLRPDPTVAATEPSAAARV